MDEKLAHDTLDSFLVYEMSRQKTHAARREAGLCIYCGERDPVEKEDGTFYLGCDPCLENRAEKKREQDQARLDRGLCLKCNNPRHEGKRLCYDHLRQDVERKIKSK